MILFVLRIFQRRIFQNISKHWSQNNLVCFEHISKKDISKLDLYLFYRIRLWLNWNVELILGENILKKWWRTECVFSWPTKVSAIGHVAPYIKGDILVITYFRKCFKTEFSFWQRSFSISTVDWIMQKSANDPLFMKIFPYSDIGPQLNFVSLIRAKYR